MSKRRASLEEFAEHEAEQERLRSELRTVNRQLAHEKRRTEQLVEAVYKAAHAAIAGMSLRPVPAPRISKKSASEEVAVAVLSDWQLGKVTPTYSSDICAARVERMAEKVIELTEIQRAHHPVRRCHVWLLGDLLEGELIFPGQPWQVDSSLYVQVQRAAEIVERFIRAMLRSFEEVRVVGVIGNHGSMGGRGRRDYNPETNFDRLAYSIARSMFQRAGEKRVSFMIPEGGNERRWYAVDRIGNYSSLLFHGDQIRGTSSFPWYGFHKRVLGWKAGAVPEHFDDAICGHFHTATRMSFSKLTVRVSGSTESSNSYAQEQLASMSDPSQWLLFAHPQKGRITAEYLVELGDDA